MKKLMFTFLLLAATNISAAVATMLFTAKKVTAQREGVGRDLKRGSKLEAGDTIITSTGATARFRYLNGTLVTIGPNSNYKIIAYAPRQSEVVINAELTKGKIESKTLGGNKREALRTPVVALAITGTTYKVYVANPKKTNIQNVEGQVKVCPPERPRCNNILKPGDSVVATPSGITPAPFPAEGNIVVTPEMEKATKFSDTARGDTGGGPQTSSDSGEESGITQDSGASQVEFLATTIVVAEGSASSTEVISTVSSAELAELSATCFYSYPTS